MRLPICVVLAVSLCDCTASIAASSMAAPTPLEVSFVDEHDLDCLAPDVKIELARGMLRADDLVARCQIERNGDRKKFQIVLDAKNEQLAEMQALRVQANLFKFTLGAAVVAAVVAITTTIIGVLK